MVSTAVTLCGVELDNPVIPASGTFGFGQEFTPYYDINILGSLSFKGTTRRRASATLCPASPSARTACSTASDCKTPASTM